MKRSFRTFSFGCRVNEAERLEINKELFKRGLIWSDNMPDIFIINTCSVAEKAEREARQFIYQTKRKYPNTKIVATGCSATYWLKNNLYKNLPIDFMIGNDQREFLADYLEKWINKSKTPAESKPFEFSGKFINSGRLLLKIQDGCNRFCSYCIVPYLRGTPKSVRINKIVSRIKNNESVAKEVILTAINTQSFGYDTGESFIDLLKTIFDKTHVPRISCGSIHPWSIDNKFIEFYKKYQSNHRLVDFFHIPIQSGSNKILNLMKRGYSREEIGEKLQLIYELNPMALIATDIIVGFLDESDCDFQETYDLLKNSLISKFHVFRYSKRQNTAAYYLAKRLKEPAEPIKAKRSKALIELGKDKYHRFLEKHNDKNFTALFLKKRYYGFQEGLLDNQVTAYIKTDSDLNGRIKNVKITGYKNSRLFGKIS